MEKIKLELTTKNFFIEHKEYTTKIDETSGIENTECKIYKIEVNPIIGIENMNLIKISYLDTLFGNENDWDEQFAEFVLRMEILSKQTNIDVASFKKADGLDPFIWGKLYDDVCEKILNYNIFRETLSKSVKNEVEKYKVKYSTGKVIEKFIGMLSGMLDKYKDIKPEDLDKIKSEASSLVEQLKQSPIANVLGEAKMDNESKKKTEYVQ
jgi:hypothetical protein